MSARELVQESTKIYKSCRAYRDHGTLRRTLKIGAAQITQSKDFSTTFERNDNFMLKWRSFDGRIKGQEEDFISYNGEKSTVNIGGDTAYEAESLAELLPGSAGISNGLSLVIPSLLIEVPDGLDPTSWNFENTGTQSVLDDNCALLITPNGKIQCWLNDQRVIRKLVMVFDYSDVDRVLETRKWISATVSLVFRFCKLELDYEFTSVSIE